MNELNMCEGERNKKNKEKEKETTHCEGEKFDVQ